MERTEIVSLYKNTPADGTVVTVCGWAKNIRDSKNIGFIALTPMTPEVQAVLNPISVPHKDSASRPLSIPNIFS